MFSFQGACLSFLFKRLNEISNCFGISVNLLVEVVGQNGLAFLRKSHAGCNSPPDCCQEPTFESILMNSLSLKPFAPDHHFFVLEVVGQNGLEPSTSRLSVVCSSQLSYWPISAHFFWWRLAGSNRWPPACKAGALPAELNPHIFHQFSSYIKILVNCQLSIVNYFRLYPLNWITQKLNTLYWP